MIWENVLNTTVPRLNTGTDLLVPIVMPLVLNVKEPLLLTVPSVTPLKCMYYKLTDLVVVNLDITWIMEFANLVVVLLLLMIVENVVWLAIH